MKKLVLSKERIANLSTDEMREINGKSVIHHTCACNDTKSCSYYLKCCPPPEGIAAAVEGNN